MTSHRAAAWPVNACQIHQTPFGALLVDRGTRAYFRLSPLAAELASLLVDGRTFVQAASAIALTFDRDPERVTAALTDACTQAPATASWPDDGFPQPSRISGSSQAFLPISASLQLTNVCNLGCSFCYASSGRPLVGEQTLSEWRRTMEALANAGVAGVTLTGGEPTLARGFPELVALASRLFAAVSVFSNGFRLDPALVTRMGQLGNVEMQVSIDGTAQIHDRLRARDGSFDSAIEVLRQCRANDIATIVSMTVMRDNLDTLEAVAEAVAEAGASVLKFGGLQTHVGRGGNHQRVDQPDGASADGPDTVTQRIERIRRRLAGDVLVLPWDSCDTPLVTFLESTTGMRMDFMNPGFLHWYVMANGDVTVCPIDDRRLGNLRVDPLHAIGDPDRLRSVRATPGGCRCMQHVRLPEANPPLCCV